MKYERLTVKRNDKNYIKTPLDGAHDCPYISHIVGKYEYTTGEAIDRLAELEEKIEKGLLIERYFVKEETNPMAEYPWVVGEIIADHNTFIVKEQCKTQAEAEAKLKELRG